MDKEARDIQDILKGFCQLDYDEYVVGFDHYGAARHLYKLGYHKLPKDKLPINTNSYMDSSRTFANVCSCSSPRELLVWDHPQYKPPIRIITNKCRFCGLVIKPRRETN